jgi:hypothetical protein
MVKHLLTEEQIINAHDGETCGDCGKFIAAAEHAEHIKQGWLPPEQVRELFADIRREGLNHP